MQTVWQDLRYGGRMLVKSPGFTAVAVFTLALGIGATTAIFSVVYGVLLRPLPYPKPNEIVQLWEVHADGHRMSVAEPNFEDIRNSAQSFGGLAEYYSGVFSIAGGSEPTRSIGAVVSRDFFRVLGVSPLVGRGFTAEDAREGATPVLLVSYGYWERYLGGLRDFSKLKLVTHNQVFSVVGVLPPDFRFPDDAELWAPRELYPKDTTSRTAHNWRVVGRVRDGVPLSQARAELSTIAQQLKQQYAPDIDMVDAAAERLQDAMTASVRPALLLLLGAVGFLLLVACANVANLLLAQASARERELAIRAALGAGRKRLVRQFLIEAALLCSASGMLGVFAAYWGVDALVALAPKNLPRLDSVSVNLPVLLFALGVCILLAAGLGTITAIRAPSGDVRDALGEGSRGQANAPRSRRFGRAIVAGQLAITLVLLVGAGLLGRSLLRVLSVDPGFRTEHIVTMDLSLASPETDAAKAQQVRLLNELFARLRGMPGVEAVGGSDVLPLSNSPDNGTFLILSQRQAPTRMEDFERLMHDPAITGDADYSVASEDYFRVLGIPLLGGRLFDDGDVMDAPHVAVINEALARSRWPNEDPLGKTIEFGNMDGDLRLLTIVGIVGNVRHRSLERAPRPTVYVNYRQRPQSTTNFTVLIRTNNPPATVVSAAQQIVHNLDPNVPPRFRTFAQVFSSSLATRRFNLTLVGVFAGTALLLAIAGVYGVMAFTVAQRTREIGVRMALGAQSGDVLRLILGQEMRQVAAGVAAGLSGALAISRLMVSLRYGVTPTDVRSYGGAAVVLAVVALLACYVPARRATRVDPTVALRYE